MSKKYLKSKEIWIAITSATGVYRTIAQQYGAKKKA